MESPYGLRPAELSLTTSECPSLPAEIWRLIFSVGDFDVYGRFWSTYDNPTMANICRCCTLFRDLVRPRLYYKFESYVFDADWHCFSVAKFAWSICTSPNLASFVHHVNIRGVCDMFPRPRVTATDDPDHPMASALINKAAELRMEFKYYEGYTNRDGGNVGFDLVALVLAQLPVMDTLNLAWFDTHTIARMPEPCGGWPWAQSRKEFFTYLAFSWFCLSARELTRFLTPVENQTLTINQLHSSRDGFEALQQPRPHQSSRGAFCFSPLLLEPHYTSSFQWKKAGKAGVAW